MPRALACGAVLLLLSSGLLPAGAAAQAAPSGPQVRAMLFGEVDYLATNRDVPGGFRLGQFVVHTIGTLTDRLNAFAEFSLTASATSFTFADERLFLRYDFNDWLKLSAGRFHTPVSYWNTAYHHGAWLETSVSRPEMIRFGTPFLPVHFLGVLAEGTIPAAGLGLAYTAGVGNGRGATPALPADAGDVNGPAAWLGALAIRPVALFGAELGGAAYFDRLGSGSTAEGERILSGHLAVDRTLQFVAEYAAVRHEPLGGGRAANSHGAYAQLGWRLAGGGRPWTPYARVETVRTSGRDAVFAPLALDYDAAIGGLRWDFAPFAALKAEYRNERFDAPGRHDSLWLQVAFTLPDLGARQGL